MNRKTTYVYQIWSMDGMCGLFIPGIKLIVAFIALGKLFNSLITNK